MFYQKIKTLQINYLYLFIFSLSLSYILYIFNMLPINSITSTGIGFSIFGIIKSLSIDFGLTASNVSYPIEWSPLTGLPYLVIAALLVKIFDISVFVASNLTISLFIFTSYISFIYIIKKFTGNMILALLIPIVFYSMPIVIGKSSYGPMMIGFMMLPFYFASYLYYQNSNTITSKLILFIMFTFALFIDGYSFMFIVLISLIFAAINLITYKNIENLKKILFISLSIATAGILYKMYIPLSDTAFHVMPLDFFRGQGVDLITLIVPQQKLFWLTNFFSYGANWNPLVFYTDGEMVYHSFLGYIFILLFIVSIFFLWKKSISLDKSLIVSLTLISLISLILSMGPSLKVNDTNLDLNQKINFQSYLMPEDKATVTMPYANLFIKIPAINSMRATHRWLIVFKFSTLIMLTIFLSFILKAFTSKWVKLLIYLSVLLMIIEFAPNIPNRSATQKMYKRAYNFVDFKIIDKIKKQVSKHSIVAIFSKENDYLSSYICAGANLRCLNAGGDKNIAIAKKYWPQPFKEIRKGHDTLENAFALLKYSDVNLIILPKFNLRWDSYGDKIRLVDLKKYNQKYKKFKDDKRFLYNDYSNFIILKLKKTREKL